MTNPNVTVLQAQVQTVDKIPSNIDLDSYTDAISNHWTSCPIPSACRLEGIERVYLFIRPEYALSLAIAAGELPYAALSKWRDSIEGMLSVYRKSRRNSVLFEVSSALRKCSRENLLVCSEIDIALANLAVYQTDEIKSILAELTASSVPLDGWDNPPSPDLNEVSERYRDLLNINKNLALEIEKINAENASKEAHLKKTREQLECDSSDKEKLFVENHTMRDQLQHERSENSRLAEQVEETLCKLSELEDRYNKLKVDYEEECKDNELLLLQLNQVQEELQKNSQQLQNYNSDFTIQNKSSSGYEKSQPLQNNEKARSGENRRFFIFQKLVDFVRFRKNLALIRKSPLFDPKWYMRNYPDVATAKADPAKHYLRFGATEGRKPGPEFDTQWYLDNYPDVAGSGMNPLVHFIRFGRAENRSIKGKIWH